MKRYAHAIRALVASMIAHVNAGYLTVIEAADKLRLNGVPMHVTLRVLTRRKHDVKKSD